MPNFEMPNNIMERMDKLQEADGKYEDSIHDLAQHENEFRDKLASYGINDKTAIDKAADLFSTETLEKMEAEKEKYIDFLTGLGNKQALMEYGPKLLSQEKRQHNSCSLLVIDLDHFKEINDSYGHEAGDAALRQITQAIRQSIRQSDFCFRYGGDEFVILITDTDIHQAKIVADKIRQTVEQTKILLDNQTDDNVTIDATVSIGCIDTKSLPDWSEDKAPITDNAIHNLIHMADQALYKSKNNGRNQIVNYYDVADDSNQ
ncbi:MAG: Diguanylate cyclase DosC [Parcubacteria group bacterium ADurb.Bin016]|nr:MAG: Diguanylate cyclase DosC [Parcubacteria group bacterium ADurb.Bin016]